MKKFNIDGLENAILGRSSWNNLRNVRVGASFLYLKGGLYQKIVDKAAGKALSSGFIVKGDDGSIDKELKRLEITKNLTTALKWTRLYGGAAILIYSRDSQDSFQVEANRNSLQRIEKIEVFTPHDLSSEIEKYDDPAKYNFGWPKYYSITKNGSKFIVHDSHLLFMSGEDTPYDHELLFPWMGLSAIGEAYNTIIDYSKSVCKMLGILDRKQQAVYGMKDLSDFMQDNEDGEDLIRRRIQLVDTVRSFLNTVAIDVEDSFIVNDLSLSGIPEIIEKLQLKLTAETQYPEHILWGTRQTGLNVNGESDMSNYHDMISDEQTYKVQPVLSKLVELIYKQKGMKEPKDWEIEWNPLSKPTAKDKVEMEDKKAAMWQKRIDGLTKAIDYDLISTEDGRKWLSSVDAYGLQRNSSVKPKEK